MARKGKTRTAFGRSPEISLLSDLIRTIRLVAFDFDGVFTDNAVYVSQDGSEAVRCFRGDALGLEKLRALRVDVAIISTETNPVVSARARKLGIPCVQGSKDKRAALEDMAREKGISLAEVAFVGNYVNDLPCLTAVGLPVIVQDAHPDVIPYGRYRTTSPSAGSGLQGSRQTPSSGWWIVLGAGTIAAMPLTSGMFPDGMRAFVWGPMAAFSLFALVVGLGTARLPAALVLIGDASYSLYLFHPYVVQAFDKVFHAFSTRDVQAYMMAGVVVVLCCILAVLLYRFAERPMSDFLRARLIRTRVPRLWEAVDGVAICPTSDRDWK